MQERVTFPEDSAGQLLSGKFGFITCGCTEQAGPDPQGPGPETGLRLGGLGSKILEGILLGALASMCISQ